MNDIKDQEQHRVSKVYLKQFGYKKGEWIISALDIMARSIEQYSVKTFSTETNLFDLPLSNIEDSRVFEIESSRFENDYGKIIKALRRDRSLSITHKITLSCYVGNMICRCNSHRQFYYDLLLDDNTRLKFLLEITMFTGKKDVALIKKVLEVLAKESWVNFVQGWIMTHLQLLLSKFSCTILKSYAS